MSECSWVALVEDKETGFKSVKSFRYGSFSSESSAKCALQESIGSIYKVLEVSTNPYKYKNK
ncbi:hypothetical protein SAMN04487895_101715 [Paenibacillus sophorae]|uniref:Uncharacterized protein n=1 Tax=Paenibacillus sophorae TaxID=1333845 RepID=A0A1H8H082_9BACL|nr:hypothetical protein [Paenibacillus sophorae]QWU14405.1 hypothetical protein KP014_21085 [Paenibacillus sophorae]SEN49791.1 hypothetical protein SAMN04487895_101715 [Paenibacillus sophorae]